MQFRKDANGDQYFALRTFRRDGTAVSTPIWLAPTVGRWYAYTAGRSWKVRRLTHDSRVEIAPSDFHGEPHGPWQTGHARILPAAETRTAKRALTAKYGPKFRFFVFAMLLAQARKHGGGGVGLEITLDADSPTSEQESSETQQRTPRHGGP